MSEGETMSKLHVDATLVAAHRMAELQAENEQLKERIGDLEQNLRVAESARDDARADSQRPARSVKELVAEAVALRDQMRNMEADDGEGPCLAHTFVGDVCRDCGLVAPRHVDGVRQCPWILDDEDPDEGYWHCKHQADHVGVHETEFGAGRDRRWMMRGNLLPGGTHEAQKPPSVCACSPKYRELAPGVHAAYCPLAGRPT